MFLGHFTSRLPVYAQILRGCILIFQFQNILYLSLHSYVSLFVLFIDKFAGVKWVIKADKYKKIKFCCLQSKAAEPYLRLSGLDREDVYRRFVFIEGHGSYYQASTGTYLS